MAISNAQQQPPEESNRAIFKGNGLPLGNSLQDQINAVESTEVIFPDVDANQPNSIICGKIDNTIAGVTTDVLQGSHDDNRYNADPLLTSDEDTITVHNEDAAITGDNADIVIENFMRNHGRSYDPTIKISAATCDPPSANPGSNEDSQGNCLGAMTRGSSGTMRNVFTISLNDISTHNYGASIGIFGAAPCDCYVPINLPLLSLVGKLGKASGVWKWFANGDTFQGLLRYTGVWGRYLARARIAVDDYWNPIVRAAKLLLDGANFRIARYRRIMLRAGTAFNAKNRLGRAVEALITRTAKEIGDLQVQVAKAVQDLAKLEADRASALADYNYASHMFGSLPDGDPALTYWIGQMAITSQNLRNISNNISQITAAKNAAQAAIASKSALQIDRLKELNQLKAEADALKAEFDAAKVNFDQAEADRAIFEPDYNAKVKGQEDAVAATQKGDSEGVLPDLIGLTFGALAALDPSRPKACFGPGTTLCKDTCACVCQDTTDTDCGNNPNEPEWSIVDIISPVQTDELKRCQPKCGCNMTRGNFSGAGVFCPCDGCESGYTWKSNTMCPCQKANLKYDASIRDMTIEWERGTCIEDDVVAQEEALGKIWGGDSAYSTACAYLCPGTSDVGLDRACGFYARLNDNLGAGAPTKEHYLYRTGCNCVCDGRDQLASGGLNQFPPVCPQGYIFDSDPHVCRCKDICSTGVCRWVVQCFGCGNIDDCTDEQGNSVPCQYEETYFTSEEYATEAEAQAFIDNNGGGGTCAPIMVLEGTSTASGTYGECP